MLSPTDLIKLFFENVHIGIGNQYHCWINEELKKGIKIELNFEGRKKIIHYVREGPRTNNFLIIFSTPFISKKREFYLCNKYMKNTNFLFKTESGQCKPYFSNKNPGILDNFIKKPEYAKYIKVFATNVLRTLKLSKAIERLDNENKDINNYVLDTSIEIASMILTTERLRSEKSLLISYIEFYKLKNDNNRDSKEILNNMFQRVNSTLVFPNNGGTSEIIKMEPDYFYEKFQQMLLVSPYYEKFDKMPESFKRELIDEFYDGKFQRMKAISEDRNLQYKSMFKIHIDILEEFFALRNLQRKLLDLLDEENDFEQKLKLFIEELNQLNIQNVDQFRSFLHLISKIFQNHHRKRNCIRIIECIILSFCDNIKSLQNSDIFKIFEKNKQLLLFLFKNKILNVDSFILSRIKSNRYSTFFFPEIKKFLTNYEINQISKEISTTNLEEFEKFRQKGENNLIECDLIRNDSIDEFRSYYDQNKLSPSSKIAYSIFETNSYLIDKNPTVIEYAAFFGSINIFKYLYNKKAEFTSSLFKYAIHGNNLDIIKLLENTVIGKNCEWIEYYIESLKCHHNQIANYIKDKYLSNSKNNLSNFFSSNLKFYNFENIENESIKDLISFNQLCSFDYVHIVKILINHGVLGFNNDNHIQICDYYFLMTFYYIILIAFIIKYNSIIYQNIK